MNINQIAYELYGKYFADLTPAQQDEVWAFCRRLSDEAQVILNREIENIKAR